MWAIILNCLEQHMYLPFKTRAIYNVLRKQKIMDNMKRETA